MCARSLEAAVIALQNWFPHGCMAPNGCDDPACTLCAHAESLVAADDTRKGEEGTRDGAPRLSGEKPRGNLAFEKRHRVGPHR
jgi:hypothetical protein